MPAFKFIGFQPTFFNGLRDAEGKQLGWIKPGDVIEQPEAPNPLFSPVDDGADIPASTEPSASAPASESAPVAPEPAPAPAPQPSPQVSQWGSPSFFNPTAAVVH